MEVIPISGMRTNRELQEALDSYSISLSPTVVRKIQRELGRDLTPVELFAYNVQWTEHCGYVSTRGLLKETFVEPGLTGGPNVLQGIEEDAGIISLLRGDDGREYGLVIAMESHNHPSQRMPFEGAATGIGGIVRDVYCMNGKVVAVLDPLRFGDPRGKHAARSRYVANGVVAGIGNGYANPLGVPNIGGDISFSGSFDENCLINVVALGTVMSDEIIHSSVPNERYNGEPLCLVVVGKPTDSSGFGGSAFASKALDEAKAQEDKGAVQVPDPFLKEVLTEAQWDAVRYLRERGLDLGRHVGYKDFGGGGFYCWSSEVGAGRGGVTVDLNRLHRVPEIVVRDGDSADARTMKSVVACGAETQERYGWIVPQSAAKGLMRIYNRDWALPDIYEGARASVVGEPRSDGRYVIKLGDEVVCDLPNEHLVGGTLFHRKATPSRRKFREPGDLREPSDYGNATLRMLYDPNIASRAPVFTTYDTSVQGNTVVMSGEADAGLIVPFEGRTIGVAASVDNNPRYGRISPYDGATNSVAESARNVAAVGATPQAIADCLNFGNPERPVAFWALKESMRGIADAVRGVGLKGYDSHLPIVSGNVSLYNESAQGGAIDPSPIVCCVGSMEDASRHVTMRLKEAGNELYLVGPRFDELGGSEYYRIVHGRLGANVPKVRFDWNGLNLERGMTYGTIDAINSGYVTAAHDISNGGLLMTLAEMAMGGRADNQNGAEIDLSTINADLRRDTKLFSESSGFVLEVPARYASGMKGAFGQYGVEPVLIGQTSGKPYLAVYDGGRNVMALGLDAMKGAWTTGLRDALR